MPPTGRLADAEISAVGKWIEDGAVWPKAVVRVEEGKHWAFEPVADPPPPAVSRSGWARTPIDCFVLARIEQQGLEPAPMADKLPLLRRAKLDLHGLPPTLAEIDGFLADEREGAFERLVDRLLAAPEYGERWGRHWLDVARYADSTGADADRPYPHAWRYRDYVVEAFNQDLPFDQFVREQIAGDLLPAEEPGAIHTRGVIATGFLGLGPKALAQRDHIQKKYDVVDEQIDTTAKTFLALTVACSRCHDHKFDPILTTDYYALASIFASTRSYDNWRQDGSNALARPLVSDAIYTPYKEGQDRIAARRGIRAAAQRLAVERHLLEVEGPRIAERMLAARRAYLTYEEAAPGLEPWVAFLEPRPDAPAYLAAWHAADDPGAAAFARERQRALLSVMAERAEKLEAWLETAEAAYQATGKAPSEGLGALRTDSFLTGLREHGAPFAFSGGEVKKLLPPPVRDRLAALDAEIGRLQGAAPPEPAMANAVAEDDRVEQRVFVRGNHANPGEPVPKRFPLILAGAEQPPIEHGSGRRELADWLASPDNPLTARVIVNRVWQWHFGEGLVRTPNNFGKVGERPTHPELLDYLARRFMDEGWSIKTLHRLIMRSAVYQMRSAAPDAAWQGDPENRLWTRFSRRRLSIEELRDSYLALSGALDRTIGGTLDEGSGRLSEEERNNRRLNPDDYARRTLYIPLMRNKIPFTLGLFDFGDATTTTGQRSVSNVAPQALFLMNGAFASRSAEGFAQRIAGAPDPLERAYLAALTRKPTEEERAEAKRFLARFDSREAGWRSFCKMLLASNEFHYVD